MLLLVFLLFVGYCKYALTCKITVKFCHKKCRGTTADAERDVVVSIQKLSGETILLFLILKETIVHLLEERRLLICVLKSEESDCRCDI